MRMKENISRRSFLYGSTSVALASYAGRKYALAEGGSPLGDAVAVWQMAGGEHEAIQTYGQVRAGVPLHGAERDASVARGGDGKVAEFRGGYLVAGDPHSPLDLSGKKQMTLAIRVRTDEPSWAAPLIGFNNPGDASGGILFPSRLNTGRVSYRTLLRSRDSRALEFVWRTQPVRERVRAEYLEYDWFKHLSKNDDFTNGILRLQAPLDVLIPERWHDITIRFNRANLELFVDGVLLDEEWPHGALDEFRGQLLIGAAYEKGRLQSGFHGQIDHLAIWDRALSDEEIVFLSGGKEEIAACSRKLLGPEQTSLQYWSPPGLNTFVGDCMPAYYDGEFHLYYLFDRHHHRSKWGMGAHQFAHASSADLVHWKHHAMAVAITEQWECSIGTGTVVEHGKNLFASYIQHGRRCWFTDAPFAGDTIHLATSSDREHFTKDFHPAVPGVYLRRENGSSGDVNPDIFLDQGNGGYYLSLSGEKIWASQDMHSWTVPEGMDAHRDVGDGICSSYFQWNEWHYLVNSAGYRMSREPLKPGWDWEQPDNPATLEGLGVPQAAPFTGNRCLLVGFLGGATYAGEAVFRELIQHADGTLGTRWPAEMIPKGGAPLRLPFIEGQAGVSAEGRNLKVSSPNGFGFGTMIKVPQDVRITLRMKPQKGVRSFGVCLRGGGQYGSGCEIRFDPESRRVRCGSPASDGAAPEPKAGGYGSDFAIGGVEGLLDPFDVDVIVRDDFVDTCIDQRRTIISKRPDRPTGDCIFFFADRGEVAFEDILIRPLL